MLLEKFDGRVPDTEAELKQLKGATSLQQSRKGMCLRPDDTSAPNHIGHISTSSFSLDVCIF